MGRIVQFIILLNGLLGIATYFGIKLVLRKGKNVLIRREPEELDKECPYCGYGQQDVDGACQRCGRNPTRWKGGEE